MWHKIILAVLNIIAPTLAAFLKPKAENKENARLALAEKLIKQAEEVIASGEEKAKYRNFTRLEIYDEDDEQYLYAIKTIWDSKQFAYFMDVLKNKLVSGIIEGNQQNAVEGQGMLKGIDYLMKNLYVSNDKYKHLKEQQNLSSEVTQ